MGDKKSGVDRRQVLKFVMIGGVATAVVMPSKWVKPVVNAVIPPAHAAASAPAAASTPAPKAAAAPATPAPVIHPASGVYNAWSMGSDGRVTVYGSDGVTPFATGTTVNINGVIYPPA